MAIKIGDTVYRNLQEQVYKNTDDIVDIKDEIQDIEDVQIPAKMSNPMTAGGDLIIGGSAGLPTRLAAGNNGQVLSTDGVSVYWDDPAGGEIEGTDVKSTGETAGKVLTADGSGGADWDNVSGEDILSTGATSGKVLTADGSGGADWDNVFGEDILSTGATAGKVLMADGSDGADWSDVTATQIKSTGMTAGKVLSADGSGGAAWSDVNGTAIKSTGVTAGKVLTADGSAGASWQDAPQNFTGSTSGVGVVLSVGTNQLSSSAGSADQILTWDGGPVWKVPTALTNPMTTLNDIIIGGAGGVPTRLPTAGIKRNLQVDDSGNVVWDYTDLDGYIRHPASSLYKIPYVNNNSKSTGWGYGKAGQQIGLGYTTTEPTAANTDGLKIAVLSSEPGTKYSGWLYVITA